MSTKRLMRLLLVTAMMLIVSAFGLIAVSCGGEQEKSKAGPEGGEYYYEESGRESLITLADGNEFTFVLNGEERSGSYSLAGTALTLTFAAEKGESPEVLNATLRDYNSLTFTYKDVSYTFLRKTEFTVHFETGGAPAIADQTVLNGKKAAMPADPEKAEQLFVGWYLDREFKTKYSFSSAVTADVTLYARFVSAIPDDPEFIVSFEPGEGVEAIDPVRTLKGVVYNLPEPQRANDVFVGWWVSATDSPDELTYRYNEERLYEHTTFYAVWESDLGGAPAVSVNAEGVSWTGGGNNYQLEISSPSGSKLSRTLDTNFFAFDASYRPNEAGKYTVTVTLGDKSTTVYYVHNALARVSVFKVEGNILQFNAVANATSYQLAIDCKTEKHTVDTVDQEGNAVTYYDFSECDMKPEGIVFTVTAKAEGFVSSVSAPFVFERTLGEVKGIAVDDATQTVSWESVENATSYLLTVTRGGQTVFSGEIAELGYALKTLDPGKIEITVQPKAYGWNSPAASGLSYDKTRLAVPTEFKLNGTVLTWKKVEGADHYTVTINGKTQTVETNEISLSGVDVGGATEITVVANASASQNDSPVSDVYRVTHGEMGNIEYSAGVLRWDTVFGASRYIVRVNDGEEITVEETSYNPVLTAKTNTISVRVDEKDSEFKSITVDAYEISFDLGYENEPPKPLYKATGDPIVLPEVKRNGYDFENWFNGSEAYTLSTFNGKEDIKLMAHWTAHEWTITFNADENYSSDKIASVKVKYGSQESLEAVSLPKPDKMPGYAFEGWYERPEGTGNKYFDYHGDATAAYAVDGDITLYARYVSVLKFEEEKDGTYRVLKDSQYINMTDEVTVPAQHEGKNVTSISDFSNCQTLKKLHIPETITNVNIGETAAAFNGSNKLVSIEVYKVEGFNNTPVYYDVEGVLFTQNQETQKDRTLVYYPAGLIRSVEKYTIPSDVEIIGESAFYNDGTTYDSSLKLMTVEIPASVSMISVNAFHNIGSLTEIIFLPTAESVQEAASLTIEKDAFEGTSRVTSIKFPKRLKELDAEILLAFTSLQRIEVEEGNAIFSADENGILYRNIETGKELAFYPRGKQETDFTIPVGVFSVGEGAFMNYFRLKTLTVPGHVTNIAKSAFEGCTGLETITFQGTETDQNLSIGERAFFGVRKYSGNQTAWNNGITELKLPANLQKIDNMAFAQLQKLTTVYVNAAGDGREEIDYAAGAFIDSTASNRATVTTVHIGKDVPAFEVTAVFGKTLKEVFVDPQSEAFYSDEKGVLYNKEMSELLFFPEEWEGDYAIPEKVTTIADSMFANRKGLSAITIHKDVTRIGKQAFLNCVNLATVTIEKDGSKLTAIGNSAFEGCTALQQIDLPEGLEEIGIEAFKGCKALKSITIPASVNKLMLGSSNALTTGDVFYIFNGCTSLSEIKVAPESIYYSSQDGVLYSLRAVTENGGEKYVEDTLLYCAENVKETITVPATVRRVASDAFNGVLGLKTVYFTDLEATTNADPEKPDVLEITFGEKAFNSCSANVNGELVGIQEIRFPDGMKTFSKNTIYYCMALQKFNVPKTVTSIEYQAFGYSTLNALNQIVFDDGGTEGLSIADSEKSKGSTGGETWTGTFSVMPALASVKFPARLTYLGSDVFTGTEEHGSVNKRYIKEVEFTAGEYGLKIAERAFYYVSSLTTLKFAEGLTSIGKNAFYMCRMTDITLPASLTALESAAFSNCTALEKVTFAPGSTLTEIGAGASNSNGVFYRCSALETVELPALLETIGAYAFYDCTSLTKVTIPANNHLSLIGNGAFCGCVLLSDFSLGSSAQNVQIAYGEDSFKNCKLTAVSFPANTVSIGKNAFSGNLQVARITFNVDLRKRSALTFIGEGAFQKTAITEISFPVTENGNLALGANMFKGCKNLTEVHLSKSVAEFSGMLNGCGSIQKIVVDRENPYFKADDEKPIIYDSTGKSIMLIYADVEGVFEIVDGATEIAQSAFANLTEVTEVRIPASVTRIGAYAFQNCINLQKVVISPDGSALTFIGKGAFHNCMSLTSINLEVASMLTTLETETATTAGTARMFSGCNSLESLKFPAALQFDGVVNTYGYYSSSTADYLFYECPVKYYDFSLCTKLTLLGKHMFAKSAAVSVKLPASVEFMGGDSSDGTFSNCVNLSRINSEEEGTIDLSATKIKYFHTTPERYMSDATKAGLSDNKSTDSNCTFRGDTSIKKVILPDCIVMLGGGMFRDCTNLTTVEGLEKATNLTSSDIFRGSGITSVTIGNVYKLGSNMFTDCVNLREVKFTNPGQAKSPSSSNGYFGAGCFQNCVSLTSFDFAQFTTLHTEEKPFYSSKAFSGSGLRTADLSMFVAMKAVPDYFFAECKELTEVKLPTEALNYLGAYTFQNCPKLSKINSDIDGTFDLSGINLTCIGTSATSASTSASSYAFDGCESVKKVVLPAKCTKLSGWVFRNCINLTEINLEKVTQIGNYSFSNTGFEELTLKKTVTSWGDGAFSSCQKLTKVTLEGFTSISGKLLFAECPLLETVIVPTTLTHLGTYTFQNDTALKRIATSESDLKDGVFDFSKCTNLTRFSSGASSNITSYSTDSYIFFGCTGLNEIKLPSKFVQVAGYAFAGCENLTSFDFTNITNIGRFAFRNTGLTEVNFGDKLTVNVFYSPFDGCDSLKTVTLAEGNTAVSLQDGALVDIKNAKVLMALPNVTLVDEASGTVTAPETLKTLADYAFFGMQGVKKLDLSKTSITQIPQYAFYGSGVEEVVLPEGVTKLGNYAFTNSKLSKINFPASLTEIGNYTFANTEFESVNIPKTITKVGEGAYAFCKKLATVVFENGDDTSAALTLTDGYNGAAKPEGSGLIDETKLTSVEKRGTFEASTVSSVTLGNRVTKLTCGMFAHAHNLKQLDIPETVVSINRSVFYDSAIQKIVLPSTVTAYNSDTFRESELEEITFNLPANSNSSTYNYFTDCKKLRTVDMSGSTIDELDYDCFNGCSALETLILPDTITKINQHAFNNCIKLTNLKLPANLEMFTGGATFENTPMLKEIVIPEGVTSIHKETFAGMTKDQKVCFMGSRFTTAQLCGMDWYLNSEATVVFNYSEEAADEMTAVGKNAEALEAPVSKKYGE